MSSKASPSAPVPGVARRSVVVLSMAAREALTEQMASAFGDIGAASERSPPRPCVRGPEPNAQVTGDPAWRRGAVHGSPPVYRSGVVVGRRERGTPASGPDQGQAPTSGP